MNITKLSDGTSTSVATSSAKRRAMNDPNDAAPVTAVRLTARPRRPVSGNSGGTPARREAL